MAGIELDTHRATDALAARIEALLRDNHALARTLEGERNENARLLAAVGRTQGENAALRETLEPARAMSDEVAVLTGRIDALTEQLIQMAEMLQRVAARGGDPGFIPDQRNEAAERLHAILTSRSWRMMRPMRGLGRIVRRIRG